MSKIDEMVAILDFGSQYTQLIARKVREAKVYCEILSFDTPAEELAAKGAKAVILSGGPASVFLKESPVCDKKIFEMGIPVLGICYGLQLMTKVLGGKIYKSKKREFGQATVAVKGKNPLFDKIDKNMAVWMSHGDKVTELPAGFKVIATTENSPMAAIAHKTKPFFGVQFHPEVAHTPKGVKMLKNFLKIAGCKAKWTMKSFVEDAIANIRKEVGKDNVLLGLSGGVDSSVLAVLLHKAIGKQLTCVFVNNGLLRMNEGEKVVETFKNKMKMNLVYADATESFLKKLNNVTDPEKKRKIIGKEFVMVFEKESKTIKNVKYLAQGTLYPDVIESRSAFGGPSVTIKTHHNVGGLPKRMKFKLLEPFKELFKDEVRKVGEELGVPEEIIYRHPFPGPGLAVRILGKITQERLDVLRQADAIYLEEMKAANLYRKIWQAFAVLLPVQSVGVMGDQRTYESTIALRAVHSTDGMTADWVKFPYGFLEKVSSRIINEVHGVNRVVYDVSTKPPSTIEWE